MARVRANLAAAVTLRALDAEHRPATPDEQAVLARWSGWGAVPGVFDEADVRFVAARAELHALLDETQYRAAARNTLNAHYTNAAYVQAIWAGLSRLGFEGGTVLEPGCGSGTFIGFAPSGAEMTGIELDPTTAAICRALYPGATVLAESFADTRAPEGHFDAAVGNVPFGRFALTDPVHNPGGHSIHSHFLLKSLHLTRPGGMVALITSRYTLDAQNPAARRELAGLGDLVFALRLPEGAHRRAAGTDAVTDLVVFRRREAGEEPAGEAFERAVRSQVADGQEAVVNEYFVAHPENVLGEFYVGRGMYGDGELGVRAEGDVIDAFTQALQRQAVAALSRGQGFRPRTGSSPTRPVALVPRSARLPERTIVVNDDGFARVENGALVPHAVPRTQAGELRALCGLRDTAKALLEAEAATRDDTAAIASLRAELNRRYDAYVAGYGAVNRCTFREVGQPDKTGQRRLAQFRPARGGFAKDPFAGVVDALEIFDPETAHARKAPLLSRRVIASSPARLGADTAEDALAICLDERGKVDLAEVARLLGAEPAEARERLGRLVFDDPASGRLVPAAEYLSGNVREKVATARQVALDDPAYLANVEALQAVLPADLGPAEIGARLGAAWIDVSYVQDFLRETLDDTYLHVEHAGGSQWAVRGGRWGAAATSMWGTSRRPGGDLAEALLRQAPVLVYDEDTDGRRIANPTETAAAQEKAALLGQRFAEWCWEDPDRASTLAAAYNERFNSLVLRSYDAAAPSLPGLALSFEPRPHQLAAVARIVAEPSTLLAHEVGAGKTAEMVMGAMELRRLGLANKPMVVVPNHMIDQFRREWLQLYPRAELLVGEADDVAGADGRRRFVARVAAGDWDGVVISHSAFGRVPLSPENQAAYLQRETDRVRAWVDRSRAAGGLSVKRLERKLLIEQEKVKTKLAAAKDDGVSFEQTGVDFVFLDEAHLFKNLHTESNIPSANIDGSKRAQDLDMKLDWLRRHNPSGRCATFATATPIANSVTEAYVVQHYLRPDLLTSAGIDDFDTWAATFGEVVPAIELSPDGTSFRSTSRFAKFANVPELLRMFHVPADVKTAEDLALPTPAIAGGKPETVVVPSSPELSALVQALGKRADAVRSRMVRPEEDNMLKISSDGRAAALDLRLGGLERPAGVTKLDVAADRIARTWAEHREHAYLDVGGEPHPRPGALQLVFCDLGTPSADRWNVYNELRKALIERGIPKDAVRFIHDAHTDQAKADLFAACRSGAVSVLIGSTEKMGVGTNVQARAVALHHLDCPWRPADLAQRDGRILRQGNQNNQVEILRYVTEGSFDTYTWLVDRTNGSIPRKVVLGCQDRLGEGSSSR
jgi:N12 class adenine-specific DNA methylase